LLLSTTFPLGCYKNAPANGGSVFFVRQQDKVGPPTLYAQTKTALLD
jgi:hypothetical protein